MLPLLYLHGLSTNDFAPALTQFLGPGASLSPATITRLTTQWQDAAAAFDKRSLAGTDYCWVDGIHLKVRRVQDKVCLLVIIGVRADGTKELIALADGFRESLQSWADLFRDCKRRGMRASVLAVGDGALGFWKALREVFPTTGEQRCWFHVSGNILAAPPKSAHPGARAALAEIYNRRGPRARPQGRKGVRGALRREVAQGGRQDHRAPRRAPRFPAEHWVHLRTTNPIDVSATVRLRQRVTKDQAHGQPASRWRSSSSRPRIPAGAPSTRPPRRPGPRRRPLREGQTRRTTRRIRR